jgi:transglutaminase-like putative cysteine protease
MIDDPSSVKVLLGFFTLLLVAPVLYAIPATLSLPPGRRPGLRPLTLAQAAEQLRSGRKTGLELVEAARALVADRMQYCRRNSFDPAPLAFQRGYGYCQQQAYALAELLQRLGFDARVVHSFRNRFPDGTEGGHAWVAVRVIGEEVQVDTIHYDVEQHALDFTPLTSVKNYTPVFRVFAGWGCIPVNAYRYYRTGKDS